MTDLKGRTAIVTGASRGIGLAIAQRLAEAGANVVLTSRDQESADAAAAQVNGNALGVAAHVAEDGAARHCIDLTVERFGGIDILVNNAGTNPAFGPLIDQDHARFAKIFDVNLWGPLLWTSLAVKAWMGEHGGTVVNTASVGGMSSAPLMGMYNATKAALIHLTKQLALELSPGVRVNAVCPGLIETGMTQGVFDFARARGTEDRIGQLNPLKRAGQPEELANVALFLASDQARWITGQTITVDGGQMLG